MQAIFKYTVGNKIDGAIFIICLIAMPVLFWNAAINTIGKIVIIALVVGVFIFAIRHNGLLNKNIVITTTVFHVNNRIILSKQIRFDEIIRIVIREEEGAYYTFYAMTIFEQAQNTRLIISDFDDKYRMINLLEERGLKYGFNVLQQNLKGKVIQTLRNRKH